MGQKAKYSLRADVFRFGPNNRHRSIGSVGPFGATSGLVRRSKKQRSFSIASSAQAGRGATQRKENDPLAPASFHNPD